jgi:ribosomal protein S18 acetylase RimI-like enzyme
MTIRPYDDTTDRAEVIRIWKELLGYETGHNEPGRAIDKKIATRDGLFFVAHDDGDSNAVIGTIMAGYDGHRGWIYSLAVCPTQQKRGVGAALLRHAEAALHRRGCVKVNLQITETNAGVVRFYEKHGYTVEPRISMGKKLVQTV